MALRRGTFLTQPQPTVGSNIGNTSLVTPSTTRVVNGKWLYGHSPNQMIVH